MILHYLKIALRNIRKYALQNAICMLGLTVGFLAISLSAYWYWFESTYDKQYKDWERMYVVKTGVSFNNTYTPVNNNIFAYLAALPQVEATARLYTNRYTYAECDYNFIKMFGVKTIAGNLEDVMENRYGNGDELRTGYTKIAITESSAKKVFGSASPIGKLLTTGQLNRILGSEIYTSPEDEEIGLMVCAVFSDFNHSFIRSLSMTNVMIGYSPQLHIGENNIYGGCMAIIKVRPGTDVKALEDELNEQLFNGDSNHTMCQLVNVSKIHELAPAGPMNIRHIRIFALTSLLLIICAVVNCITMIVSRITGRRKEMGLRRSCGSSYRNLIMMMSVEMAFMFIASLLVALLSVAWISDSYSEYTMIGGMSARIVWGCVVIMAVVFVISMIAGIIAMTYILRESLNAMMTSGRSRSRQFRIVGLTVQICISLLCLFCSVTIVRQLEFVRNANWGFGVKGVTIIELQKDINVFYSRYNKEDIDAMDQEQEAEIKQDISNSRNMYIQQICQKLNALPMVKSAQPSGVNMTKEIMRMEYELKTALTEDAPVARVLELPIDGINNDAYGFTIIQGSKPQKLRADEIVLSQKVCKMLALDDPIGKTVYLNDDFDPRPQTIVAVIADVYLDGPLSEPAPFVINDVNTKWDFLGSRYDWSYIYENNNVTVRYDTDMRNEFSAELKEILSDAPQGTTVYYMDDWMNDFLKPTNDLLKLMAFAGLICVLIAISGIYMAVTLSCQERRREIAVRKVHGARIMDITSVLLKEYGIALTVASVIAFPIGTVLMRIWLKQFAIIVPMGWLTYVALLAGMILMILLTVGHRVIKTSRENPADVIKSE